MCLRCPHQLVSLCIFLYLSLSHCKCICAVRIGLYLSVSLCISFYHLVNGNLHCPCMIWSWPIQPTLRRIHSKFRASESRDFKSEIFLRINFIEKRRGWSAIGLFCFRGILFNFMQKKYWRVLRTTFFEILRNVSTKLSRSSSGLA